MVTDRPLTAEDYGLCGALISGAGESCPNPRLPFCQEHWERPRRAWWRRGRARRRREVTAELRESTAIRLGEIVMEIAKRYPIQPRPRWSFDDAIHRPIGATPYEMGAELFDRVVAPLLAEADQPRPPKAVHPPTS